CREKATALPRIVPSWSGNVRGASRSRSATLEHLLLNGPAVPCARLIAALCCLCVGGCYGTRNVGVAGIAPLQRGGNRREVLLSSGLMGVHIGPRSWVRFRL